MSSDLSGCNWAVTSACSGANGSVPSNQGCGGAPADACSECLSACKGLPGCCTGVGCICAGKC